MLSEGKIAALRRQSPRAFGAAGSRSGSPSRRGPRQRHWRWPWSLRLRGARAGPRGSSSPPSGGDTPNLQGAEDGRARLL